MIVKVNRTVDFLERVGWTTAQAAASAALTYLSGANLDWATGLKFVGFAALTAALKVIAAQQRSTSGQGAAPDPVEKTHGARQ